MITNQCHYTYLLIISTLHTLHSAFLHDFLSKSHAQKCMHMSFGVILTPVIASLELKLIVVHSRFRIVAMSFEISLPFIITVTTEN